MKTKATDGHGSTTAYSISSRSIRDFHTPDLANGGQRSSRSDKQLAGTKISIRRTQPRTHQLISPGGGWRPEGKRVGRSEEGCSRQLFAKLGFLEIRGKKVGKYTFVI